METRDICELLLGNANTLALNTDAGTEALETPIAHAGDDLPADVYASTAYK
jgi:hypothetical protein